MKKIILFLIVLIFAGCENKTSEIEVLSKIYVEELLSREEFGKDYNAYKIHFEEILAENGYTENEYRASLEKLSDDREQWDDFFNKSLAYLKELKAQADSTDDRN